MTITGGTLPSNVSLSYGLKADRPDNPKESNMYLATDTKEFFVCYVAGEWADASPAIPIMNEERTLILKEYSLSDDILVSNDAEVTITGGDTWRLVKQIAFPTDYISDDDIVRVSFDMYNNYGTTYQLIAKLMIDGVDIGVEQTAYSSSSSWFTKTQDVVVPKGSTLELWARGGTVSDRKLRYFRVKGAFAEPFGAVSFT